MVVDARFEGRGDPPAASDGAVFGRQVRAQAQAAHLRQQDQVARGSAAVDHLASLDETAPGRVFSLHEKGRQANAASDQKIKRFRSRVGEAIAERTKHGDSITRLGALKQRGPTADPFGKQIRPPFGRDREQGYRSRQKGIPAPVAAKHNELPRPAAGERVASAEAQHEVVIAQCAIFYDSRVKIPHRLSVDGFYTRGRPLRHDHMRVLPVSLWRKRHAHNR